MGPDGTNDVIEFIEGMTWGDGMANWDLWIDMDGRLIYGDLYLTDLGDHVYPNDLIIPGSIYDLEY